MLSFASLSESREQSVQIMAILFKIVNKRDKFLVKKPANYLSNIPLHPRILECLKPNLIVCLRVQQTRNLKTEQEIAES